MVCGHIHHAEIRHIDGVLYINDGDWVWAESMWGKVRGLCRYSEAVEPGTVWTWNAIGKSDGAWRLAPGADESRKGFLLNHLISEELPRAINGAQDNGTRLRAGNSGIYNQVIGGDGMGTAYSRDNTNTVIGSAQGSSMRTNVSNTPPVVFHTLGIEASSKQMLAIVAGGVFGASCLIGLLLLLARRLGDARLRATTRRMDLVVLFWILATLLLGLVSIVFSLGHADGSVMLLLMAWARAIVTLDFSAAAIIVTVPWIYKLHMFMGMTLFLLFPFSRLVHVWSGFGALGYLGRSYQLVRSRR